MPVTVYHWVTCILQRPPKSLAQASSLLVSVSSDQLTPVLGPGCLIGLVYWSGIVYREPLGGSVG